MPPGRIAVKSRTVRGRIGGGGGRWVERGRRGRGRGGGGSRGRCRPCGGEGSEDHEAARAHARGVHPSSSRDGSRGRGRRLGGRGRAREAHRGEARSLPPGGAGREPDGDRAARPRHGPPAARLDQHRPLRALHEGRRLPRPAALHRREDHGRDRGGHPCRRGAAGGAARGRERGHRAGQDALLQHPPGALGLRDRRRDERRLRERSRHRARTPRER